MNVYSQSSASRLETCDERLRRVFGIVLPHYDHSILCGHRSDEEQDLAFFTGRSKLRAGQSKHNQVPSLAVDAAPWYAGEDPRIPWNIDRPENRLRFTLFAGFVLGVAAAEGIRLRWGGDWDSDRRMNDQSFHDLPHFEIVEGDLIT